MIISFDGGHKYIKIMAGPSKRKLYEAVLGEIQPSLSQNGTEQQVTTDDGRWFVGKSARQFSHSFITGNDESWPLSCHYRALLFYGVSQLTSPETGSVVVDLVASLPISDYRRSKQEFADSLLGVHSALCPGRRPLTVDIRKVKVLPQGLAPAHSFMIGDTVGGTLDNGSRTTNAIRWAGNTVESAGSSECGATQLLVDIAARIQEETGRQYTPFEVVEILSGNREVRVSGQPFDAAGIIDYLVDTYAESIISSVAEIHGNAADLDTLVVFGGGALLVGNAIKERYPQAVILKNPQWASAEAQLDYGKSKFR